MDYTFTPTQVMKEAIKVPFIEDARADFAPFYSVRAKDDRAIKDGIYTELAKLGAGNIQFQEGYFGEKPKRYGYIIRFMIGSNPAQMIAAGLPMKSETAAKRLQVKLQALYVLHSWLKTAVTAQVFSPGNHPLMQFLLVDGQHTLAEYIVENRHLPDSNPMLASGD